MEAGIIEANLGGHIYKKRIALPGQGKSGSTQTIIAFKFDDKAFFIYGFEKNQHANITDKEEKALKKLAKILFSYDEEELKIAIKHGDLIEVIL